MEYSWLESKIKIYVGVDDVMCLLRILKLVARTRLLHWLDGGSNDTALLPLLLLKIRYVRMLGKIVCSGSLVWLRRCYTHPGRWIHLPFRGHWPCRLRSNNGSCSRSNDWQHPTNPRRRIPAFIPHGIKASVCVCVNIYVIYIYIYIYIY